MPITQWLPPAQVNTSTTLNQFDASVAAVGDGFVVVWTNEDPASGDGSSQSVMMQRYDASGNRLGIETLVNTTTGSIQASADVIGLTTGGFVIAWRDFSNTTNLGTDMRFRRYDANGVALDVADQVLALPDSQSSVKLAPITSGALDGGFVAVITSQVNNGDIFAQRFETFGSPVGAVIPVSVDANFAREPVVTMLAGGDFVVSWLNQQVSQIFQQRFNANGTLDGVETQASNVANVDEHSTAALANGGYVMAWGDNSAVFPDTDNGAIRARIFDNLGQPSGSVFLVNSITFGSQFEVDVVGLRGGGFVITYISSGPSGAFVAGQAYHADGSRNGAEFLLDTPQLQSGALRIEELSDGRLVVTNAAFDANLGGVFFRILDPRDGLVNGTTVGETLFGNNLYSDQMFGRSGNDILHGLAGNDTMDGGAGLDTLHGGRGDDTLYGGADNDTFFGGLGADDIYGDSGTDLVSFTASTAGVNVNLFTGLGFGGEAEGDTYSSIESFAGTKFDDVVVSTSANSRMDGFRGDDTMTGGSGADVFFGGAGADTLNGGGGVDRAFYSVSTAVTINLLTNVNIGGEAQGDVLTNIEEISGSAFGDTITGNTLKNRLLGQNGNDRLDGGAGADTLTGGSGSDSFVFVLGQSGTTLTTLDNIGDYFIGGVGVGDEIDANIALTIGGSAAAASASQASIDATTGVATFFAGSGVSLADALLDINGRMAAIGHTAGDFAFFELGGAGDNFMFISDGVAGLGSNDVVIRLQGIGNIGGIAITAGDVTILS